MRFISTSCSCHQLLITVRQIIMALAPAVLLMISVAATAQNAMNKSKVSAHLQKMVSLADSRDMAATTTSDKGQKSVDVLSTLTMPVDATAFFERHGCRLIDSVGRIYVVSMPLNKVATLSNNDTVERIEAERMPRPLMDVTPQQVNATGLYAGTNLPQAYTGAGVVAGIFDSYFDFTHPAFSDSNGNCRIQYYYDFHWPNADSTYGHALESASAIAAQQHSLYTRNGLHGTHVAGIMAGSGTISTVARKGTMSGAKYGQFQGMAPEADIYLVDFNSDRNQFANPDENTSAIAVLGFKKIFDKAEEAGKPCVVNFSSGESVIFTSQRVLEGEAMQALTGPGRIIVSSAGNDGTRSCYLEKGADNYQAGTGIENGLYSGQIIDIDLITPGDQYVRFDFMGMSLMGGGIEGTIAFHTDSIPSAGSHFTAPLSMGDVQLDVVPLDFQDPRGSVYHIHGVMPNLLYLLLCGASVLLTSNNPAYMYSDIAYSPFLNVSSVPQYSFAKKGYSITWPAMQPGIIAVGATGYKNTFVNIDGETNDDLISFAPDQMGHITKFSSCGPTFNGLTKPDVVAPGYNISSAYNSFYEDFDGMRKNLTYSGTYNGQTYYYVAESGTSMAAPVVAGVIALWLQAKPDLTPAQALEVIRRTSTHPDDTMTYPNNIYGYGQIDAYRGLLEVLNLPVSIPELSREQPKEVTFRLENHHLYADFGNSVPQRLVFNIYTIDGRLILTQSGKNDIDLSWLGTGVYAVQLITDSKTTTGSTLIRLK